MSVVAIIGHGRSPERKRWAKRIDACDVVVRMWDNQWQDPADYGTRYDYGLFEVHPSMMQAFHAHRERMPAIGWVASVLGQPERCELPACTELVDQKRWNEIGLRLGGVGKTGRLQFTRGTIAACWAIERAEPGDEIVLVGFDNIHIGESLPIGQAFSEAYRANPGTFTFAGYKAGESKYGNHDYAIERPVMQHLARSHGVALSFAQDRWIDDAPPSRQPRSGKLRALVLGDARDVLAEAAAALAMFTPDAVFATSNIGIVWPGRVDYWCTLHPERCQNWPGILEALHQRLAEGRNRPQIWAHKKADGIDCATPDWAGSTGLLAVKIARLENFERIVLAGVPMDSQPHFYSEKPWREVPAFIGGWRKRNNEISPYVRSMSGWTMQTFGPPTQEWLAT